MVSVHLKVLDEGLSADTDSLVTFMSSQLIKDNIQIKKGADLTLKIKFTVDNDQEKVLVQLRESGTKVKLGEKVIHYFPESYIEDITNEGHALVASLAHSSAEA
jgi:hypothetical protein